VLNRLNELASKGSRPYDFIGFDSHKSPSES
jgi:hypothetical protein